MKTYIYIAFFICLSNILSAQPVSEYKVEDMLEIADIATEESDFYNAIQWYNKAYRKNRDKDLKLAVADLYMVLRDYKKAAKTYEILLRRDKNNRYINSRIDYAQALAYQGQYNGAISILNDYANNAQNDSLKMVAVNMINDIRATEILPENVRVRPRFMQGDINSGNGENSPAYNPVDQTFYFSSMDEKGVIDTKKKSNFGAKIFKATKDSKGKYKAVEVRGINLNGTNNYGVNFSADGNTMYFCRAQLDNNYPYGSSIFVSYRTGDGWGNPKMIFKGDDETEYRHPAEGTLFGERVLFFISNRLGGLGGYDIYYSKVDGDNYSSPINLGENINTPANDITPFFKDNTFYFSTNGRGGLGGYDIFKSSWDGQSFSKSENLGQRYNSSVDDFYYRIRHDDKAAYLVSNRPDASKRKIKGSTTCCDDIYEINVDDYIVNLVTTVKDADGPLNEATIQVVDLENRIDNTQTKTSIDKSVFNFGLEEDKQYKVIATRDGYYPDSTIVFNTYNINEDKTFNKEIVLKPIPKYTTPEEDIVEEVININEPIRLGNIYYDLDKWDILPESEQDLSYLKNLMDQYPDMVIELSSHTDSRGVTRYNQKLSQKRANSAKAWLVSRGISGDRIKSVGYGESKILNRCVNGIRCSEEEHRLNRRTEFKIIEGPQTIVVRKKKVRGTSSATPMIQNSFNYPVLTFKNNNIDIGSIRKGDSKEVTFEFTNTGKQNLVIEIVTACKCTDLVWPKGIVKPGESGVIKATFHTKDQHLGDLVKTLNIVANTDPIVTEARFAAKVLPATKKM